MPLLIGLVVPALVLDAVDGWVARRTGTMTELGARFDMEVDAFLLLVLSAYVAPILGLWVLAIGLMRYVFVAAGWVLPWLRLQLPYRYWRKVVTAVQGIALTLAASGLIPESPVWSSGSHWSCSSSRSVVTWCGWRSEAGPRGSRWARRDDAPGRFAGADTRSCGPLAAEDDRGGDAEDHDADGIDDDRLRYEGEVPRLGDAEQPDGEGEQRAPRGSR